uniref:TonB-dependent receptor plug domain-containing protein n=1 Tax=Ningiella ruwaisensis TaxID=2364274 RepID=UPI001446A443|nr:TonB-dependent receptor [Ningiella ruwaisensis]
MLFKYAVIAASIASSFYTLANDLEQIGRTDTQAQAPELSSELASVEQIKVTGTRLPDAPVGALSIISREEIEQINPASTIDLLRRVPHLDIAENGNAGGFSYVSIRGGEFNFTLVMIDGVAVNDSTNSRGGGFDFNQVNPAAIERIEVYRGGINTIYGGEAVSGVINIITREQTRPVISLEAGSNRQLNASLTGSHAVTENIDLLLSASTQNKTVSDFESVHSRQGLAKLSVDGERSQYNALVTYNSTDVEGFTEDSGGELLAIPRISEARDSEQWLFSTTGIWSVKDSVKLHGNLSFLEREESINNPGIAPGVFDGIPASLITSEYERGEVDLYADWRVSPETSFIAGLNLRQQDGKNRGTLDFGFPLPVDYDFSQDTKSAFVEAQHTIDALTIQGSIRYDSPDDFDSETSFRLGANYALDETSKLFAVFNQGYKLPSFFALAHPLVGNADLQPERSDNFELGFEHSIGNDLSYSLVYFYNQFEDLIDFDAALFTNVNRNAVDTQGIEFDTRFALSNNVALTANVRYLDIDADQGVTLRKRPSWAGNLQLDYTYQALSTAIFVDFRDEFLDSAIPTGYVELGGYATLGASALYDFNEHIDITFNIENALGKEYQDAVGFVQDDIEVRFGLIYAF